MRPARQGIPENLSPLSRPTRTGRPGRFSEPEQWRYGWERVYTRDEGLDQLPTHGILTRLDPGQLAVVRDRVGAAIDALSGRFTMRYTTVAVTAALS